MQQASGGLRRCARERIGDLVVCNVEVYGLDHLCIKIVELIHFGPHLCEEGGEVCNGGHGVGCDGLDLRGWGVCAWSFGGGPPQSAGAGKIGARGMAGGSSVVEEEEAVALPLALLPAMLGVGVATVGRGSGGEWG